MYGIMYITLYVLAVVVDISVLVFRYTCFIKTNWMHIKCTYQKILQSKKKTERSRPVSPQKLTQ